MATQRRWTKKSSDLSPLPQVHLQGPDIKFTFTGQEYSSWAVWIKLWFWLSLLSLHQSLLWGLINCQSCVNSFSGRQVPFWLASSFMRFPRKFQFHGFYCSGGMIAKGRDTSVSLEYLPSCSERLWRYILLFPLPQTWLRRECGCSQTQGAVIDYCTLQVSNKVKFHCHQVENNDLFWKEKFYRSLSIWAHISAVALTQYMQIHSWLWES